MRKLTGKIAPEHIRLMDVPRPPEGVVEGIRALGDPVSTISDTMDTLGLAGAIGASILKPTLDESAVVGPALTLRNIILAGDETVWDRARRGHNSMAEFEAHNLTTPGDVLVIDGVQGISNMGGVSATIAKRQGSAGAIVSGAIRDLGHSRSIDYPVWASEISPVTGKWRIETIEINGPIQIFGIKVNPGDIVVADSTGVCFIPRDKAEMVLELARKKSKLEAVRLEAVKNGAPIWDLPKPDKAAAP